MLRFELLFINPALQQLIVQAGKHCEAQLPGQRGVLIDGEGAAGRDVVGEERGR